jgi:ribosomal-protein-alanine N-acetyltransferase
MRSALTGLITLAFSEHGLHRLEANIQPENERSCSLIESLGFRLEALSPRYLRIAGVWRDHKRYALTSEEWQPDGAT